MRAIAAVAGGLAQVIPIRPGLLPAPESEKRLSMARRAEENATALEEGVGKARPKKSGLSARQVAGLVMKMNAMRESRDWSGATPGVLVALWAWCHESVYGVAPEEAGSPAQFSKACMRAGQLVKASFAGSCAQAVEMMRWVWAREKRRWSSPDANRGRRIGWPLMFSASMVGDWRVATAGRVPGK